jgi:hypothetical protein
MITNREGVTGPSTAHFGPACRRGSLTLCCEEPVSPDEGVVVHRGIWHAFRASLGRESRERRAGEDVCLEPISLGVNYEP